MTRSTATPRSLSSSRLIVISLLAPERQLPAKLFVQTEWPTNLAMSAAKLILGLQPIPQRDTHRKPAAGRLNHGQGTGQLELGRDQAEQHDPAEGVAAPRGQYPDHLAVTDTRERACQARAHALEPRHEQIHE